MRNPDNLDSDKESMREDWRSHPFTEQSRRELERQEAAAFDRFRRTCEDSSDPEVRGALVMWKYVLANFEFFGGKR